MKLAELEAIARYIKSRYSYIKKARRVENNTIELVFDGESLFFDMTRGQSVVYIAPSNRPSQEFNAPFDKALYQYLSHSKIVDIYLLNGDRVLVFKVEPKSQYKKQIVKALFEFTGRYTNVILVDSQDRVIEALHHIDESKSHRVVKPNVKLLSIPPKPQKRDDKVLSDEEIRDILIENGKRLLNRKLENLKSVKLRQIDKKIKKIKQELDKLPNSDELLKKANSYENMANIILANLHTISQYDKELKTIDFDGREVTIPLPKGIKKNRFSEYYFNLAKRSRSKANNLHIEKENLQGKLKFYENIAQAIKSAKDIYTLELLVPKRGRSKRKKEKLKDAELYWIDGYKVYVGRNAKENQKILSLAKANDIWMHVRGVPSSHIIIRTDKQNLPDSLLQSAAKLCVDFSIKQPGNYEVDYTRRKFVKIQEGSNVEYDKYKTISVIKEGVEIRE